MYKTLRKESFKCVLPRVIACAVAAAVLLAVCGGGLQRLLRGPETLNETVTNGAYVSFDASEVIVAFASLTANSDSGSTTLKTYYLLPVGDGHYIAVMDEKERNSNVLNRAMEQSREYYLGDLETLTPLGPIQGTVKPLEDDMLDYMVDCIDEYALPGYEEGQDSGRLILDWQVELNRVGLLSETWTKVLGVAAAIILLLLAAQLVVLYTGCYQRRVRAVLGNAVSDDVFRQAEKIERVRVGAYIWYSKGPGSRVIKTERIIWGYAMPEPMVVSKYRWPVAIYDLDQRMTRINFMDKNSCEVFLEAIAAQGNPFVKGYTSEYAKKFQESLPAFQKEAEAQARLAEKPQQV